MFKRVIYHLLPLLSAEFVMRAPLKFKIIFAKEIDLSLQQQAIKLTDRELSKSKTEAE